jgi:hypothetical protein
MPENHDAIAQASNRNDAPSCDRLRSLSADNARGRAGAAATGFDSPGAARQLVKTRGIRGVVVGLLDDAELAA